MNISAPFIARPIATWLLAIGILLSGALGYRSLPVSALPEVDFPTIQVVTQLPGVPANPPPDADTTRRVLATIDRYAETSPEMTMFGQLILDALPEVRAR